MDIWAVCIGAVNPAVAERLIDYLPPRSKNKVLQYRQVDDRLRSLTGGMLAQVYAFEQWGLSGNRFVPVRSCYGKPALPGYPYQYNVSHSGKWVVCAFAKHTAVGIDVEMIRPIDLEVADRFFSGSEVASLSLQPEDQRISYFYQLWTLKESYIKAKGEGLSIPLNAFSFKLDQGQIEFQTTLDSESWHFCQYSLDSDYEMSVCGLTREFPEQINFIAWMDLADRFQRAATG